jgi:DNA sulfur modification protein DndC
MPTQPLFTQAEPAATIAERLDDLTSVLRRIQEELQFEYLSTKPALPWIVGYSGGKDSTLMVQLVFEMLMGLAPSDRVRPVHIVSNDTLVESPVIITFVEKMLDRLRSGADNLHLPITIAKTTPDLEQTFWVNLIGRGYPPPTSQFRWCTDRMKIQPTSGYVKSQISAAGEVILLLGVRKAESSSRAGRMSQYTPADGSRLNPHNDLQGCWVYRPIMDMTTEEVWQVLLQRRPPWGGSHRDLITLYRNAQGGECPLVMEKSQAPSCGSSSSRFGCWTCTVVDKDHSMEGFVDAGFDHLEPLLDFRDWLIIMRNDKTKRMVQRRSGLATFDRHNRLIPGPFTLEARDEILQRLLETQQATGAPLISQAEIEKIQAIWSADMVDHARRLLEGNGIKLAKTGGGM